jgi:acetylglutamate kinase
MNKSYFNPAVSSSLSFIDSAPSKTSETLVIKIGGAALKQPELVRALCLEVKLLSNKGYTIVLVHGGGPSITEELQAKGIASYFHEGQRITTPEMMDVIEMVLCGKINRRIVRTLNSVGVSALGLAGTDDRLLVCDKASDILQCVGVIKSVNRDLLIDFVRNPQTRIPVISPLGYLEEGSAVNVNADWAAIRIAEALGANRLIYMTDQDGILDPKQRLMSELDTQGLEDLISTQVVTGGMLAKVQTILYGLRHDIGSIQILNAKKPYQLSEVLLQGARLGSICQLSPEDMRGNIQL